MPRRSFAELRFPYSGLNEAFAFNGQRPDTSAKLQNVRAFDPTSGRSRGSQRAGLTKYLSAQHEGGANHIQGLFSAAFAKDAAYSATTLPTRDIKRIAVCAGDVNTFTTAAFATPTSGSNALLSTAPIIQMAQLFDKVYFADSSSEKLYNMTTDTVSAWTASAGTMPNDGTYKPRLICTYRGRICLAGLPKDPANWFMSAVGDATDFDYSPTVVVETQAMSGANSEAGKVGDSITALISIEDDILVFGGDHSISRMVGDPMAGGRIDNVTNTTGMLFGSPHTRDPQGNMYFFEVVVACIG